jgi:tetraacyldisaccharide 4'-kinase
MVCVAVDKSRKEGCDFLCNPELLQTSKKARRCKNKDIPKADLIILDDAFQHRAIKASANIVLIDYSRPLFKDHLMPLGKLRDLPERISAADIVVVSKCPGDLNAWEKSQWAEALGINMYDAAACKGQRANGKSQYLFFTKIQYDTPVAVFEEGDPRYVYSKRLVLFSGIANDTPMRAFLSSDYKIVRHLKFPDHHKFSNADIRTIEDATKDYPTAVVMTTEKDCQRIRDCRKISDNLKMKLFYTPIKSEFLSFEDRERFTAAVKSFLK